MLRPASLLLVCLLGTLPALAQSPKHEQLKSLDSQRFQAQINKDSVTLKRLLSDDLLYTHSSGLQERKADYIRNTVGGKWDYRAVETDSVQVRFFGPTAVITGYAKITLMMNGQLTPVRMMYTDVWHQTNKKWQLVSWAASRLAN